MPIKLAAVFFLAYSCAGQNLLRQYLALSTGQTAAILQFNADFTIYADAQNQILAQRTFDLYTLSVLPGANPADLGELAIKIETIRRSSVMNAQLLQQKVAAQLTPAQSTLLSDLIATSELLPLVQEARCAHLVSGSPSSWFDTTTFYTYLLPYPPVINIPLAQSGLFCGSSIFPISVRQYLSLTDSQVNTIVHSTSAYADFYSRKQNRLQELNLLAEAMLATPGTNPDMLGLLYAEMIQIGKDLRIRLNQLQDEAQSVITPVQSVKLKNLKTAAELDTAGVFSTAANCRFLVFPTASSSYATEPQGFYPRCFL